METERIKMGLVGCGGMSGAHMGGYRELWSKDVREFDIVAACDIDKGRAENRANEAHAFQGGTKPAVYTELDEMLDKHPDLECVDICALHSAHHVLAVPALEAGKKTRHHRKAVWYYDACMQTDDGSSGQKR